MHRWPRRLAVLATALLTFVGFGAVVLAPAAYATHPGCGNLCDYKSPNYMYWDPNEIPHVCSDSAGTARTATPTPGVTIELRYSTLCRTTWARTGGVGFGIKVESFYANGTYRATATSVTTEGIRYSLMLNDAGLYNRACVNVPLTNNYWACTTTY